MSCGCVVFALSRFVHGVNSMICQIITFTVKTLPPTLMILKPVDSYICCVCACMPRKITSKCLRG